MTQLLLLLCPLWLLLTTGCLPVVTVEPKPTATGLFTGRLTIEPIPPHDARDYHGEAVSEVVVMEVADSPPLVLSERPREPRVVGEVEPGTRLMLLEPSYRFSLVEDVPVGEVAVVSGTYQSFWGNGEELNIFIVEAVLRALPKHRRPDGVLFVQVPGAGDAPGR